MKELQTVRVLLRIAYDGTSYCGFQEQKSGVPTIERSLREAIGMLTGEDTEIIGGSRTDAGVHAHDNVAVFDTSSRIPPEKFALALNRYLERWVSVPFIMSPSSRFQLQGAHKRANP